jgi:hypothetical protein
MSCKTYLYKGSELTEEQLIQRLSQDPNITEAYRSQEERQGSDYEIEDRDSFQAKVDALQRTMNVEVIYDENIESSRLLGKNDPRTKAAGRPVILINPNQLFKTTAIHEFGHVFIDSFPGGLENPRLQKALDQLRGSELWAEVEALYPELSERMLHKEILVTAIGREGSNIWDSGQDRSKWESFMAWLSDYLKRTFGLERSEIMSLSKELLNNKVKKIDATKLEEIDQKLKSLFFKKDSKNKTEAEEKFDSLQNKIEKTYSNLLGIVTKVYKNQIKDTESSKQAEKENLKKGGTRLSSIKDLQEKLNRYDKADARLGFVRYMSWAKNELDFMDAELDRRDDKKMMDTDTLKKAYDWSSSFTIVDEIQNLIEGLRNDERLTEKEHGISRELVSELKKVKTKIDSKLITHSRARYAEMLINNDSQTEEGYKKGIRETWAELEAVGGSGMQEGEYVIQQLAEMREEIQETKREIAEARAEEDISSMSMLSMGLLTEKEMSSKDIALISNTLDNSSGRIERFSTEEATNEDAFHKKFREDSSIENSSSRNMKKKYEKMFTTTESGQSYYTTEYSPEFIEKKNQMSLEKGDTEIQDEKYGKVNVTLKTDKEGTRTFDYDSTVPSSETGKEMSRRLRIPGGTEVRVDGFDSLEKGERAVHVSFKTKGGKRMKISLNEAIARSEYGWWVETNTKKTKVTVDGERRTIKKPTDKWKSDEYIDLQKNHPKKFKELERLIENGVEANERYDHINSIVENHEDAMFMRLPGVMKTAASRVAEGQSIKTMTKDAVSRLIERQKDDYDVESYTDFQQGETLRVPSPYRARLQESDQSFDLHTIGLLNSIMSKNYQEKKSIEASLIVITEVMKKKKFPVIDSVSGEQKIDAQSKDPIWISGSDSQEYKKALSVIENRLYGITSKQAKSIKILGRTVETQQVVKTGLKYFGTVSLVFNYANSIINTGTGSISNLIEAVGGDVYNLRDYKKAQVLYNSDLKDIMADIGSNVKKSTTNLLINNFNVFGPDHLSNNFEEGTRVEALANMNSLRPIAQAGEHMMQSKVMYAILSSIKTQNAKGQWIGVDGNVVTSKKSAASLVDMITFKENASGGKKMVLHESVQNTSFTTGGGQEAILNETRNLIRSKVDELHGQYTSDIQAHAQRYMLGKMGFFLRKWMMPGYIRRFRGFKNSFKAADTELAETDEFYSHDQKENLEGYYIAAVRFLSKVVKDTKTDGFNVIKSWKELTSKQKAGVRKTMADVGFMVLTIVAYNLLAGDGDLDDDEVFLAYLLRRQQSELTFFANPVEAFKIAQTPTAAVGNLKNIVKTLNYVYPGNWGEKYESGPYSGDLKIYHMGKKLLPRFKNTEDFRQALDFLNSSR